MTQSPKNIAISFATRQKIKFTQIMKKREVVSKVTDTTSSIFIAMHTEY